MEAVISPDSSADSVRTTLISGCWPASSLLHRRRCSMNDYNPYESVSAVRRPLCSAWRVMLNYVKSHVQQASVIAAPVRLFTCHSTGHVSSCPHRAVRSTAPLLLLLLLMQMLPSSTETPYAVLWRADVRLILTTPGRTAVNNKS